MMVSFFMASLRGDTSTQVVNECFKSFTKSNEANKASGFRFSLRTFEIIHVSSEKIGESTKGVFVSFLPIGHP